MNVRCGNAVLTAGRPAEGEAAAGGETDGERREGETEGAGTDEAEEAPGTEGKHPLKPKVKEAVAKRRRRMVVAPDGLAHVHDTSQATSRENDCDR